jgi:cellulose synthase/poly-beta-1,6-N-acetylglucosamine synthase-like glycosyltransferase
MSFCGEMVTAAIILFLLTALYYIGAVFFLWRGLSILRPSGTPQNLKFSIVIAARNEERTIDSCLASIVRQELPPDRYEVIVVNDRSCDRTGALCREYAGRYPNISVIDVNETPPGSAPKKYAVSRGIARARYEAVVLTDADCVVPPSWLETIDRNFTEATTLVQGVTVYGTAEGMNSFFYNLQAVDFLSHGIVAAAAIGAGLPLNANANNLAFRKKTFDEVNGYGTASQRVVSGDDDLLLQRIAACRAGDIVFMADPAGAVTTRPTPTLRGVFEQRKRWGSKTVHYTLKQEFFLSGIFLFYCAIVASLAAGIICPAFWKVFALLLGIKIAGEYLLMLRGTALFNRKELRPYILPASLVQLPLVLAAVVMGVFGKFSWKGERFNRVVK